MAWISGSSTGVVTTISETASTIMPSRISSSMTASRIAQSGRPEAVSDSVSSCGTRTMLR